MSGRVGSYHDRFTIQDVSKGTYSGLLNWDNWKQCLLQYRELCITMSQVIRHRVVPICVCFCESQTCLTGMPICWVVFASRTYTVVFLLLIVLNARECARAPESCNVSAYSFSSSWRPDKLGRLHKADKGLAVQSLVLVNRISYLRMRMCIVC